MSKTTSCSRVTSSGSSRPIPYASAIDHGPAASTTLSHSITSPPTRTPRTRPFAISMPPTGVPSSAVAPARRDASM